MMKMAEDKDGGEGGQEGKAKRQMKMWTPDKDKATKMMRKG